MKRYISIIVIAIFTLTLLAGCSRSMNDVIEKEPHFVGVVETLNESHAIVIINEDDPLYSEHTSVQISLDAELKDSYLSLSPGDEIVVYYDGKIADGSAETIYAITLRTPAAKR